MASSSTNTITSNAPIIYHPEYDINTGNYVDVWPVPPRTTCFTYICYCNGGGSRMSNKTQYSYHTKLKSHRLYISNYNERINNIDTAKDYINNLLKKNHKLEIEVLKLKQQLQNNSPVKETDFMVDLD
jgi:hypothetical protein